jgi:hypothetical protein
VLHLFWRYANSLIEKVVVNDDVPRLNRSESVGVVYLSIVRQIEYEFDELELLLEPID